MGTPRCWLVLWTVKVKDFTSLEGYRYYDHWIARDSYSDAQKEYRKLCNLETTYSASVCLPVDSTDY